MLDSKRPRMDRRLTQLDASCALTAFQRGYLAASPQAAILEDPLVYTGPEEQPHTRFMFSDIPDAYFREPSVVIWLSHLGGGTKS